MYECLNGRFVEVTKIAGGLSRFLAHHECLWVDKSEGIDNDFAFDRLYGIDDNGDGACVELFEGLLCVDVDAREPTAESWM